MKEQGQTLLARVHNTHLKRALIALWGLILAAQCTIYIIKFPSMITRATQVNQGTTLSEPGWVISNALIIALVGIGVWIYVLANSISTNPRWMPFWVRLLITTIGVLASIGLCINVLTW